MKKVLVSILALVMLCASLSALAEGNEAVTLEVNTAKLTVYAADDANAAAFRSGENAENTLPVLLLGVKKSLTLQAAVKPATVKNKKTVLSVADETVAQVRGNAVTGLKAGETVLTVASEQDPSAAEQYLLVVYVPVTRINVSADSKTVAAGQTVALKAAVVPEDATVKDVTWTSSAEDIAKVDENGTVTGVKRGNVRITATAKDGGKIHSDFYMQVSQNAEQVTLDKQELTIDTGRNGLLKATVLPKETNDKAVVWTSSDEKIAKVNSNGQVTGVARGDCEIICTSKNDANVWAKAAVHVQQPVKKISFGAVPAVYAGETGVLTWTVEPADASNPAVKLTSSDTGILTIAEDGTITGVSTGTATVKAVATDGSNRQAQIKVHVLQHVTGVRMRRDVAYIDPGESAVASAVITPERNTNHNMTWTSADESIATAKRDKTQGDHVRIKGIKKGETTITGTTEDGGHTTSIDVKVGDWSHLADITDACITGKGKLEITVKNISKHVTLTWFKIEIEAFDSKGKPVIINKKDKTNKVIATLERTVEPGKTTPEDKWKLQDYDDEAGFQRMTIRLLEYQIEGDWVKQLRKSLQPTYTYKPKKN